MRKHSTTAAALVCPQNKGPTQDWLAETVQRLQLVAGTCPATCAELCYFLANLVETIPPPCMELQSICARYFLHDACLKVATTAVGAHYSAPDVWQGWASVWTALQLISTEPWSGLAAELRRLAERNQDFTCLPRRVELYLRGRFSQVCHLDDVAREAGTSLRVMTKMFRREYRCTVHQFVSALRLRAAIRLLTESDLKISAISQSVGYGSQADLYRHLRRYMSCTPGAVRLNKSCGRNVLRTLDEWFRSHGLTA